MYNASDTRAIRKAQKAARQAEAERDIVITALVSTIPGRAYVHDLLVRCHVFSSSYNTSALAMAFHEGERNVGLQLIADVTRCAPDQFTQMMREYNDRSNSDRRGWSNAITNGRDKQPDGPTGDDGTAPGVETDYDPYADTDGAEDGSERGA